VSEKRQHLARHLDVTRKGARRIAEIVQAGVSILLEEGFTALTKRRIAARLDISHGNVSYYFPTRESLWRAVIDYEYKEYYRKHYGSLRADPDDPQALFDEFVLRWIDEYLDREMRIFFSQVLAFAEVNETVARLRDEIYEMFLKETLSRVRPLNPGVPESEIELRALVLVSTLEGLHAVSAFRPGLVSRDDAFRQRLLRQMNAVARGQPIGE